MLDFLIQGGTVIDGTGSPGRPGDVGIRDGRVVAVTEPGGIDEAATETIDATGLVVAPGFVDPHTHYDAQLFWDPQASPSTEHGVTTIIGGNCGFTLAPVKAEDADYLRRMMAKVEGMPLPALEQGVPWNWSTFGEYLDRLEGNVAVNTAFSYGHRLLDLEPHGRSELAAQQLLLERGQQVLGVVLLDLEVLVAGDPEGVHLLDLHAGEQALEVLPDDVLERHEPLVPERDEPAKIGGTFTRAKCCLSDFGLRRATARFSDSPEMYGNGCAGSTASGVRTGNTRSLKSFLQYFCSSRSRSAHRTSSMPLSDSEGTRSSRNSCACRSLSSRDLVQISSRISRGSRPDAARTATPAAIRRLRPATRTMKNSSRLLVKIAANRTRSRSGSWRSSASSRTRWLSRSQDSSRSRKRSSCFSIASRTASSGTYGGSTSKTSSEGPDPSSTCVSSDMRASVSPLGERTVTYCRTHL